MNMAMTTEEIIREYKLAKDKRRQIEILADQNCCSKKDIAFLLHENGLEVDKRFFNSMAKKAEPVVDPDPGPETADEAPATCILTQQEALALKEIIEASVEKGLCFKDMPALLRLAGIYEKLAICDGGDEENG